MAQALSVPDGSVVKNHLQCRSHRKTQVQSLGQEDPREESMATQVFLPGESHDRGAWQAIVSVTLVDEYARDSNISFLKRSSLIPISTASQSCDCLSLRGQDPHCSLLET